MRLHTDYVCCDKCHRAGQKGKVDISSLLAINHEKTALASFWNGLIYKIPMCCNIYYCKLILAGVRPAITVSYLRGDQWRFRDVKLTDVEREYIKSRGVKL